MMTSDLKSANSGFRLLEVAALDQSYVMLEPGELPEGEANSRDIGFLWDWRITSERRFDIFIGIRVAGNKSAPEEARVLLIGSFEAAGADRPVTCKDFVQKMGPAILFPYAREIIASLTSRGPFGAFHLPAMNVLVLMKGEDYEQSTGGKQIREDPELAREYGFEVEQEVLPLE